MSKKKILFWTLFEFGTLILNVCLLIRNIKGFFANTSFSAFIGDVASAILLVYLISIPVVVLSLIFTTKENFIKKVFYLLSSILMAPVLHVQLPFIHLGALLGKRYDTSSDSYATGKYYEEKSEKTPQKSKQECDRELEKFFQEISYSRKLSYETDDCRINSIKVWKYSGLAQRIIHIEGKVTIYNIGSFGENKQDNFDSQIDRIVNAIEAKLRELSHYNDYYDPNKWKFNTSNFKGVAASGYKL